MRRESELFLITVHGRFQPFSKQDGETLGRERNPFIEWSFFGWAQRIQNIRGGIYPFGRSANPHLQPQEGIPAHRSDKRSNPLMPSVPTSLLEAHPPKREVEIVMDNDQIL